MNSRFHIGSCAWTYDDWRGSFYPADLPRERWFNYYASIFNCVEIDSTFYRNPPASTVARWLAEAPPHFRFTCKAPKLITHQLKLRDCAKPLGDFLEAMEPLHTHLGTVLVQLPPSFSPQKDGTALREFVRTVPHGWRFAIEFRDAEWHQPRFVKLLEEHNVCWTWNDTTSVADQDVAPFGFLPETADFLYVRLMGDLTTKYAPGGQRRHKYREVQWPRRLAIESWSVRLQKQLENESVKNIYILCSNHYEGFAPATCRSFGDLLGLNFPPPPAAEEPLSGRPKQMKLL